MSNEREQAVDREILALYAADNKEEALRLFAGQYQARLYSLAYRMLGHHDDAMDALQEILVQVNRSMGSFHGRSGLFTWVYRVASHVCLNYRRKRSRTASPVAWDENLPPGMVLAVERPEEDPDKMCETKYKQFLVQQAILRLPETQRVLLVLHDMEGMTVPEIADILHISVEAAKARIHRGRSALRKVITQGFEVKGMEGVGRVTVSPSGQLM